MPANTDLLSYNDLHVAKIPENALAFSVFLYEFTISQFLEYVYAFF